MGCQRSGQRLTGAAATRADNGLVVDVEPGRFEEMVITALDGLPEDLGRLMRNVAVTVEHDPGPPGLLGLYEDRPSDQPDVGLCGRPPRPDHHLPPGDLRRLPDRAGGRDQVRRTVIHEIAHHFGIDDDRLTELGW